MSVIKQISVYNGSSWEGPHDIGANAENIALSSQIVGSTVLSTALSNILPTAKLDNNKILITSGTGQLAVNKNVPSSKIDFLKNVSSDIQGQLDNKLPLTGGRIKGYLGIDSNITQGSTHNNSSATFGRTLYLYDNSSTASKVMAGFRPYIASGTSGPSGFNLYTAKVVGSGSSTTNIVNGIYLGIHNTGERYVAFSSGGYTAWRTALDLNKRSAFYEDNKNFASGADKMVTSFKVPYDGIYLLLISGNIRAVTSNEANPRGALYCSTAKNTAGGINRMFTGRVPLAKSGTTDIHIGGFCTCSTNLTYYVNMYHNYGANTTVGTGVNAIYLGAN